MYTDVSTAGRTPRQPPDRIVSMGTQLRDWLDSAANLSDGPDYLRRWGEQAVAGEAALRAAGRADLAELVAVQGRTCALVAVWLHDLLTAPRLLPFPVRPAPRRFWQRGSSLWSRLRTAARNVLLGRPRRGF
jgi:hypothetical protein